MKRKIALIFAAFALILLMASCAAAAGGDIEPSPGQNEKPEKPEVTPPLVIGGITDDKPNPEPVQPVGQEYEFTNPFTGLGTEKDLSSNRPVAVIFNNFKKAAPQRGISGADVIYEAVAEGGITRIMGVFMDITATPEIGSIRSMRPYFIDLAKCISPIFIHAGGSDDAYVKIKNEGIASIDGVNGSDYIFFRDNARKKTAGYEHSLMADTSLLPEHLEKRKLRSENTETADIGFKFGDSSAASGASAASVTASFSASKNTSFKYSDDDGLYYASQHGGKMTDEATGAQLAVKNIIIMKAKTSTLDDAGRVSVTTTGSGSGYYVCGGSYVEITWSRSSSGHVFTYETSDGREITLAPGVTYVCVIPNNMSAAFE